MRNWVLAIGCMMAISAFVENANGTTELDELMPRPMRVEVRSGRIEIVEHNRVSIDRSAVPDAPLETAEESYVLDISTSGTVITAVGPKGEHWARVTLEQLKKLSGDGSLPNCRIVDWPSLKWRGCMLDTVRNYLPVSAIKDVLDQMSAYKLNLFHWHLTENYAWRLESKRYPELQSDRAFVLRHRGKYYTQDEFREIADYAYARGISIMPEFDFPGHTLAFMRAFGCETMSDPRVPQIAIDLFQELCSLVPAEKMPFIHMGTDEVFKRELEGVAPETLTRMAKSICDNNRSVVSWVPGEKYECPGRHVNMIWWIDLIDPKTVRGPCLDASGMYIENYDPFEMLQKTVYRRVADSDIPNGHWEGAVFCAWHDGFVGLPYENLLRNQQIFPACVIFGNAFWNRPAKSEDAFLKRLPLASDGRLKDAEDIERRVIAQRDKVLKTIRYPFHFIRQTDMRWRLSGEDGRLIATDIAQATIIPETFGVKAPSNRVVTAETWIRSPVDQDVGAWIGFTGMTRDHGLVYSAPLPNRGEWNRFGANVELNGERVSPPNWSRPGLEKGKPIEGWTKSWTLYEADEVPFTDQEYFMREPTSIHLRTGWNHVKLTVPNPDPAITNKTFAHRWIATFAPVLGPTDHPREVPGLEYSATPKRE